MSHIKFSTIVKNPRAMFIYINDYVLISAQPIVCIQKVEKKHANLIKSERQAMACHDDNKGGCLHEQYNYLIRLLIWGGNICS